ncbi:hypothetical protein V2J09_017554 [Rumex salicifolius]
MMYGGDAQHQQRQPPQGQQPPPHLQPPLPPGPPPPYAQLQQHQPPHGMEYQRGPPPPMQMNRQPSAPSTANPHQHPPPYEAHADSYAAKRMRKLTQRRAVDYTSTIVRYIQARMWQRDSRDRTSLQPIPAAVVDLLPAAAYSDNPSTSFAAKFVHTSINKVRCPIYRVLWTPNGRRLITGSQSGEFTLWNGQSFNFEMIIQAHDNAISSMVWSHNGNWMVSGDNGGSIKYWQTNMNNVKVNKSAHKESIRDLRTDLKFCSCSDDTTVKVWDFAKCQEESSLTGHGWDVKCVDWHPSKSLLVSGGKDNLVKLWDAKSGKELCSFHGHKNTVLSAKWNDNGNWVLTASKDQIIKLYDIRAMKELESFRGHSKDVTALAWHPFHEDYFVSGSFDGSIFHWIVGHETPQIEMPNAHENAVWDLSWHPVGYLLCSGSNDHTTKFWCRNRPGDANRDKFNGGYNQGYGEQNPAFSNRVAMNFSMPDGPTTPGSFPPGLARNEGTIPGVGAAMPLNFSSLDASSQGEQKPGSMPLGAPPLPPGPHPSLLAPGQNPVYQQNPQQMQQQSVPQQMPPFPMGPPHNMQQLQPPSHMNVLQNPHLPRPLQQMPPLGMPGSMGGQPSMQSHPSMPGSMGGPSQMGPPQGHYMGTGAGGGFPNGMSNIQSNSSGGAMYPPHGGFNRPQSGQMPMMPGLNPYQPGNPNAMPPPLPPGPPPQQTQQ